MRFCAAQHCTGAEIVELLIKAGADVNTKAPGGATSPMFAKIFGRTETEAVMRKAGARD
jgi:ankyrin repeat protein